MFAREDFSTFRRIQKDAKIVGLADASENDFNLNPITMLFGRQRKFQLGVFTLT